jgi:hypothetical protein
MANNIGKQVLNSKTQTSAHCPNAHKYAVLLLSMLALCLIAANTGTVLALSASGGGNFNETITINTTIQSIDQVNNSNLYFEIRASDGTVVGTHSFEGVPSMNAGDTFSYTWTSHNGSYPLQGDYSLTLCWSPGNSRNCTIASATSSFYAANTLGPFLIFTLIAFIVWRMWKQQRVSELST